MIRVLLGWVVFVVAAFLALRHPSPLLAIALVVARWACLIVSFVVVLSKPTGRRGFLFGFGLFAWTYFALGCTISPELPPLVSPRLLDLVSPRWREYPPYYVGEVRSLANLMFGLIGGTAALLIYGCKAEP